MVRYCNRWSAAVVAVVALTMLLAAERVNAGGEQQATKYVAMGANLFATYCTSCHGTTGRGDGPLASAMKRKPANLLEIAKRHQGAFPSELVYKVIDGRAKVPGHGGPDMPVWGDAFMRTADGADQASVQHRIQALVDYLETIQARNTQ